MKTTELQFIFTTNAHSHCLWKGVDDAVLLTYRVDLSECLVHDSNHKLAVTLQISQTNPSFDTSIDGIFVPLRFARAATTHAGRSWQHRISLLVQGSRPGDSAPATRAANSPPSACRRLPAEAAGCLKWDLNRSSTLHRAGKSVRSREEANASRARHQRLSPAM